HFLYVALLIALSCRVAHPALHSFPTRRSSDLCIQSAHYEHRTTQYERCGYHERAGPEFIEQRTHERGQRAVQQTAGQKQYARCRDRKSTRLNSSHVSISYAVFCLKKKKRLYE